MVIRRSSVKNYSIIFDVGKVIVDFSIERFRLLMENLGAQVGSVEEFIEQTDMPAYERGKISSDDYLQNVERLLPCPPPRAALQECWQDIFSPIPDMLELLLCLKQNYRVLLLSNTNELHWRFLEDKYNIMRYADDALTSFWAGSAKPEPEIFALAESKFALAPEKIIYVDDLQANIQAAQARRWRGILHTGYAQTVALLREAGIRVE